MRRAAVVLAVLMVGCLGEAPNPIYVYSRAEVDAKSRENAERLYQVAREKMRRSEFEAAIEDLYEAERLDPECDVVRELAFEVRRILARAPLGYSTGVGWSSGRPETNRVSEQTLLEIRSLVTNGEHRLKRGNLGAALQAFCDAEQMTVLSPFDDPEISALRLWATDGKSVVLEKLRAVLVTERN